MKYTEFVNKVIETCTPEQLRFLYTLYENDKITSLGIRYLKAIAGNYKIPEVIGNCKFKSLEDAFAYLDALEYSAYYGNDLDDYDYNMMRQLQYYFPPLK